jgi:hypothetical protein
MNIDEIKIIDNFLSDDEMQFVKEYFKQSIWAFGLKSTSSTIGTMFKAELKDEPFFNEYIFNKICKKFNWSNVNAVEIHANGQTILNNGTWHDDYLKNASRNKMWTLLLYVSDITPDNVEHIQGHTEIRMNDNSILSIEPFRNRLVLFDSSRLHRGLGPSVPGFLRVSITYKIKEIE